MFTAIIIQESVGTQFSNSNEVLALIPESERSNVSSVKSVEGEIGNMTESLALRFYHMAAQDLGISTSNVHAVHYKELEDGCLFWPR